MALAETIARYELPITPFDDLLTAFEQDQTVMRYPTYEALLGYCRPRSGVNGDFAARSWWGAVVCLALVAGWIWV